MSYAGLSLSPSSVRFTRLQKLSQVGTIGFVLIERSEAARLILTGAGILALLGPRPPDHPRPLRIGENGRRSRLMISGISDPG